jgi:hypothetical protein
VGCEVMHFIAPALDLSTLPFEGHIKDKIAMKAEHLVRASLVP